MLRTNPILHNPFKEIRGYVDERHKLKLEDELAWALIHLMQAGRLGCSPESLMAPGLSQLICELRKVGIGIKTVRAKDLKGRGFRLRYVLHSDILITGIDLTEAFNYAD
ncbi:hypothetical protein BB934_43895 (plasmid) [Microvirga ossetica]|uniref:Winged helix domain-containing protein n=1 Tax=Microvirga ossetica TaxID=1882682 RepID=A0A1B2EYX2_9HYPH|nr:hypothetical protein [Microvirga ossetica]ANY85143.1 hypothetical protein BB934_43895 [Microvirga ossetica]